MPNFPDDAWHWEAEYVGGARLHEHSVAGGLPFAAIDQARLVALHLIPNYAHLDRYTLRLHPGQRPIFFRRRTLTVPLDGGPLSRVSVTALGWQATIDGRNVQYVWHFHDDGRVEKPGGQP